MVNFADNPTNIAGMCRPCACGLSKTSSKTDRHLQKCQQWLMVADPCRFLSKLHPSYLPISVPRFRKIWYLFNTEMRTCFLHQLAYKNGNSFTIHNTNFCPK